MSPSSQYKVPTGRTGLAIRWIVDHLSKHPGAAMRDVLKEACQICCISPSSRHLTALAGRTPVDRLWKRKKRPDGLIGLWLLPEGESIVGTFLPRYQAMRQDKVNKLQKLGHQIGGISEVVAFKKVHVNGKILSEMHVVVALILDVNLDGTVRILYNQKVLSVDMDRLQVNRASF